MVTGGISGVSTNINFTHPGVQWQAVQVSKCILNCSPMRSLAISLAGMLLLTAGHVNAMSFGNGNQFQAPDPPRNLLIEGQRSPLFGVEFLRSRTNVTALPFRFGWALPPSAAIGPLRGAVQIAYSLRLAAIMRNATTETIWKTNKIFSNQVDCQLVTYYRVYCCTHSAVTALDFPQPNLNAAIDHDIQLLVAKCSLQRASTRT